MVERSFQLGLPEEVFSVVLVQQTFFVLIVLALAAQSLFAV